YSKVYLGDTENKQLHKCLDLLYSSPELIIDKELQNKIIQIKEKTNNLQRFKEEVKRKIPNNRIQIKIYKITVRKSLIYEKNNVFDSKKIESISDSAGCTKAILLNHLKKFDTIELPFQEAIKYFDALMEKQEFIAVVGDTENE